MKKTNKIVGYLLLLLGLVMIIYPVFNVYQVFKGQMLPYNLFFFKPISIDLSKVVQGAPNNVNLSREIISSDLLDKRMNLVAHIVLMSFIVSAGFKIASIGVMLARSIKVKIKEEKVTQTWK